MLDDGALAGTCLNTGCTPTKALVHAVDLYRCCFNAAEYGTHFSDLHLESSEVFEYARRVVADGLRENEERLAKIPSVTWVKKRGTFVNEEEVQAGGEMYSAPNFLVATGARPFVPPIEGLDQTPFLTHADLIGLERHPSSLAIVGGGFISAEYATIFHALGTKVSVFEVAPRLVPAADEAISQALAEHFHREGVGVHLKTAVEKVELGGGEEEGGAIHLRASGVELDVEKLVVAAGFVGNTSELGLDAAKVKVDRRGYVKVDATLRTTNYRVWAIGDVVGHAQFTHMALREARVVVRNMFDDAGLAVSFDDVPYAVFTLPPVASVGKTEAQLREAGVDYQVAQTEFGRCSRGVIERPGGGTMVKLLHNGVKILGFHAFGPNADVLVGEVLPLVRLPNGMEVLRELVHPHPTWLELFNNLTA